jgi:hypothetical protein
MVANNETLKKLQLGQLGCSLSFLSAIFKDLPKVPLQSKSAFHSKSAFVVEKCLFSRKVHVKSKSAPLTEMARFVE